MEMTRKEMPKVHVLTALESMVLTIHMCACLHMYVYVCWIVFRVILRSRRDSVRWEIQMCICACTCSCTCTCICVYTSCTYMHPRFMYVHVHNLCMYFPGVFPDGCLLHSLWPTACAPDSHPAYCSQSLLQGQLLDGHSHVSHMLNHTCMFITKCIHLLQEVYKLTRALITGLSPISKTT